MHFHETFSFPSAAIRAEWKRNRASPTWTDLPASARFCPRRKLTRSPLGEPRLIDRGLHCSQLSENHWKVWRLFSLLDLAFPSFTFLSWKKIKWETMINNELRRRGFIESSNSGGREEVEERGGKTWLKVRFMKRKDRSIAKVWFSWCSRQFQHHPLYRFRNSTWRCMYVSEAIGQQEKEKGEVHACCASAEESATTATFLPSSPNDSTIADNSL